MSLGSTVITTALFWEKHPALLYGLLGMLAYAASLQASPVLLVPFAVIVFPLAFHPCGKSRLRLVLAAAFAAAVYLMGTWACHFPILPENAVNGIAKIQISQIDTLRTPFGEQYLYKGKLQTFISEDKKIQIRNGAYSLTLPKKENRNRPLGYCAYLVNGKIKESSKGAYILQPKKEAGWKPVPRTWSLAEARFRLKERCKYFLLKRISSKRAHALLSGLTTGSFDDRLLKENFARFGLQHIMAISGFHFSLLALMFSGIARIFLSPVKTAAATLFFLTGYFIFLGFSPSILRAWLSTAIFFGAQIFGKQSVPLNSLGIALMALLFINPLLLFNLGFQLSFLVTASILFFYPIAETCLQRIFPVRTLSEAEKMPLLTQHAYLLLNFIRQVLALTLAVNLSAMPITLFFFHKFPLMSLVYNVFFPLLVSIAMFLLLLGWLTAWLTPISNLFFTGAGVFADQTLNLVYNLPVTYDYWLRTKSLSEEGIIIYLSLLLFLGIAAKISGKNSRSFAWI